MKICSTGAELFHAGERADMAKLIIAFRNFANASKTTPDNKLTYPASPNTIDYLD